MITHERNTCQLKILEKIAEKSIFVQIFFNKFARKFSCNVKILVVRTHYTLI